MPKDHNDDGHTIFDMSAVPGRPPAEEEPVRKTQFTAGERISSVFGALAAALSIGLIYIIVFGAVIFLMIRLWKG